METELRPGSEVALNSAQEDNRARADTGAGGVRGETAPADQVPGPPGFTVEPTNPEVDVNKAHSRSSGEQSFQVIRHSESDGTGNLKLSAILQDSKIPFSTLFKPLGLVETLLDDWKPPRRQVRYKAEQGQDCDDLRGATPEGALRCFNVPLGRSPDADRLPKGHSATKNPKGAPQQRRAVVDPERAEGRCQDFPSYEDEEPGEGPIDPVGDAKRKLSSPVTGEVIAAPGPVHGGTAAFRGRGGCRRIGLHACAARRLVRGSRGGSLSPILGERLSQSWYPRISPSEEMVSCSTPLYCPTAISPSVFAEILALPDSRVRGGGPVCEKYRDAEDNPHAKSSGDSTGQ